MADIMEQGGYYQRLNAADRDAIEAAIIPPLQEGTQGSNGKIVATEAMFVACIGGARPDTIDKSKLLHLLQAKKRGGTNQFLFARAKRDPFIETVAHGTYGLFVR
jgi:hypothetical protein